MRNPHTLILLNFFPTDYVSARLEIFLFEFYLISIKFFFILSKYTYKEVRQSATICCYTRAGALISHLEGAGRRAWINTSDRTFSSMEDLKLHFTIYVESIIFKSRFQNTLILKKYTKMCQESVNYIQENNLKHRSFEVCLPATGGHVLRTNEQSIQWLHLD